MRREIDPQPFSMDGKIMPKVTSYRFDSHDTQRKLPRRNKPYFKELGRGKFIGFRKSEQTGEETWLARRILGPKDRPQKAFGKLDHITDPAKRYQHAKVEAEKWFAEQDKLIEKTGIVASSKMTLHRVMQEYIDDQQVKNGHLAARGCRSRFKLLVAPYKDKSGKGWHETPLSKITTPEFDAWRTWLVQLPTKAGGAKRSAATVNRDVASFRAALNLAHRKHSIADVWSSVLKRTPEVDDSAEARAKRRSLDIDERRKLLAAAEEVTPALVPFMKLMLTVPIRPGALAHMLVEDYKPGHNVFVRKDKTKQCTGRTVHLRDNPDTYALMESLCKGEGNVGKLKSAPLLTNPYDGGHWQAHQWGREIKKAAKHAGLPDDLSMYWLRHSRITDMIRGDDEGKNQVSPMEVAIIAGTSVDIIQKHYLDSNKHSQQRAQHVAGY